MWARRVWSLPGGSSRLYRIRDVSSGGEMYILKITRDRGVQAGSSIHRQNKPNKRFSRDLPTPKLSYTSDIGAIGADRRFCIRQYYYLYRWLRLKLETKVPGPNENLPAPMVPDRLYVAPYRWYLPGLFIMQTFHAKVFRIYRTNAEEDESQILKRSHPLSQPNPRSH